MRDPEGSRNLVAATRSHARASEEAQQQAVALPETESQNAPVPQEAPRSATKAKAKVCSRGKQSSEVITFRGSPPPDPHSKWVGQQDKTEIPNGRRLLEAPSGFPDGLLVVEDDQRRRRIIVPLEQRERLVKQEHISLLHVGPERVARALTKRHVVSRLSGQQDAVAKTQPRIR